MFTYQHSLDGNIAAPLHKSPFAPELGPLTSVADMPGYPTRNALFGGPQTRTKAVITDQVLL